MMEKKVITKLILKILLGNKNSLTKAVKLKGKIYVLNVEEYRPMSEILKNVQEKVL